MDSAGFQQDGNIIMLQESARDSRDICFDPMYKYVYNKLLLMLSMQFVAAAVASASVSPVPVCVVFAAYASLQVLVNRE